jgi:hypothetical protein
MTYTEKGIITHINISKRRKIERERECRSDHGPTWKEQKKRRRGSL